MTFSGYVQDGVIIPETPLGLANGVKVEIHVLPARATEAEPNPDEPLGPHHSLMNWCGIVKDLEPDASSRIDEVLYGGRREE